MKENERGVVGGEKLEMTEGCSPASLGLKQGVAAPPFDNGTSVEGLAYLVLQTTESQLHTQLPRLL